MAENSTQAVQQRAALRKAIKREFQKQVHNPHRHGSGEGGHLFDPAVQRFMSMRVTTHDFFRATPKTSLYGFFLAVVPFASYCWWIKTDREKFEEKCRTGQVSYADREFKFV